jgi:hypothetical protein
MKPESESSALVKLNVGHPDHLMVGMTVTTTTTTTTTRMKVMGGRMPKFGVSACLSKN